LINATDQTYPVVDLAWADQEAEVVGAAHRIQIVSRSIIVLAL
jgi:hypothetical protein